jgi:hypothetical protein
MMAAKTTESEGVALKIIAAPLPKVSAAKRAGSADGEVKRYRVSSNVQGRPRRTRLSGEVLHRQMHTGFCHPRR